MKLTTTVGQLKNATIHDLDCTVKRQVRAITERLARTVFTSASIYTNNGEIVEVEFSFNITFELITKSNTPRNEKSDTFFLCKLQIYINTGFIKLTLEPPASILSVFEPFCCPVLSYEATKARLVGVWVAKAIPALLKTKYYYNPGFYLHRWQD